MSDLRITVIMGCANQAVAGYAHENIVKLQEKKVTFIVNQIVLTGMVLSVAPVGEYDRRVVILTKEDLSLCKGIKKTEQSIGGSGKSIYFR